MRKPYVCISLLFAVFIFVASCGGGSGSSGGAGSRNSSGASATLTWTAPSQNIDNTQLTDLRGYKVYYGDFPGHYDYVIDVGNVTTTTIQLNNLPTGRLYFFAVRAYNLAGVESDFSSELSKMIN
jgi:hypothetical protein